MHLLILISLYIKIEFNHILDSAIDVSLWITLSNMHLTSKQAREVFSELFFIY